MWFNQRYDKPIWTKDGRLLVFYPPKPEQPEESVGVAGDRRPILKTTPLLDVLRKEYPVVGRIVGWSPHHILFDTGLFREGDVLKCGLGRLRLTSPGQRLGSNWRYAYRVLPMCQLHTGDVWERVDTKI